jgi:Tfp pilus assembly protein PilO
MSNVSFLDQLNLRPAEKRIVFVILVVVFFALNYFMVWPHFNDWAKIRGELDTTRVKFGEQTKEIVMDLDPTNGYKKQLARLEREQKGGVSQVFDEALLLQKTVAAQAPRCGVDIGSRVPGASLPNTNEFFDEQTLQISFEAGESNLVNFLYDVGNDPSMVRVRELRLDPIDPGRYKLRGSILLAANDEKRAAASAPAPQPNNPRKRTNAPPGALPRTKT